jgi:hypothetical protein
LNKIVPLILLAAIANILTISLYNYVAGQPGGSGLTLAFSVIWMPLLWISVTIATIILCIIYRKILFAKLMLKLTIPAVLFCTPIPLLILFNIIHPPSDTYGAEGDYIEKGNYTLKHEEWVYHSNGKLAVNKYYRFNRPSDEDQDEDKKIRDSTWTYFNKSGDTVKIEHYKNGHLFSTDRRI